MIFLAVSIENLQIWPVYSNVFCLLIDNDHVHATVETGIIFKIVVFVL